MSGSLLLLGKVPVQTCQLPTRSFRSYVPTLESFLCHQSHSQKITNDKLLFKDVVFSSQSVRCNKLKPVSASSTENADPIDKETVELKRGKDFEEWDSLTAKFAGAANIPFLLLQLPQIILNTRNLLAGNTAALSAVPWLGMFTGLLGNLSLLSYFIKKKETEAMVVQALGVISMYVVILQLAIAEAMPFPHFIGTSIVVGFGLIVNFMKYFNFLNPTLWGLWEEFITIAGLSALPQVMWSTFIPYVPNTVLPGAIAFISAVITVVMVMWSTFIPYVPNTVLPGARMGKIPEKGVKFLGYVSAWTATLLFMWMPVAQMWTNILNPENIKGLSAVSMLLAMIGNGLMIPRALIIRDLMWFTGATWACVFYGWGNLICLYCLDSISKEFFLASTFGFLAWIGTTFWRDSHVYGLSSPFTSLKQLLFGP